MMRRAHGNSLTPTLSRKRERERDGFTLIEVMIATSILAVVCGLVWGSFHETFKAKQIIDQQGDRIFTP